MGIIGDGLLWSGDPFGIEIGDGKAS